MRACGRPRQGLHESRTARHRFRGRPERRSSRFSAAARRCRAQPILRRPQARGLPKGSIPVVSKPVRRGRTRSKRRRSAVFLCAFAALSVLALADQVPGRLSGEPPAPASPWPKCYVSGRSDELRLVFDRGLAFGAGGVVEAPGGLVVGGGDPLELVGARVRPLAGT